jgi:ribosomal protein L32
MISALVSASLDTCQTCGRVLLPDTAAKNCQEHVHGQSS